MEFTPHQLMFIWDATAFYAARPVFDGLPECEQMFEAIGLKCQEELAKQGWTLTRCEDVDLSQR